MVTKRKSDGEKAPVKEQAAKPAKPGKGGIGSAPAPVETEPTELSESDEVAPQKVKGKRGRKPSPPAITIAPEEAAKIRNHLKAEIREEGDKTLSLGRDLVKVVDGKLYASWGFKTFKDYVQSELDFQPRSANSLISMARLADVLGQTRPDADEKIREIGKVKLMALGTMLTPENLSEMHSLATSGSVRDVLKYAKANRPKKESKTGDAVNRNFKLLPDQDETLKEALDLAASLSDGRSDKPATPGFCLDVMAQIFIATHSGDPTKFADIASKIEENLGVQIVIALDGEILYGSTENLTSTKPTPPASLSNTDIDLA